ncbi:MAG: hypothetical protein ACUVX8_10650 [Candidatus Zipacnadales bacterium]
MKLLDRYILFDLLKAVGSGLLLFVGLVVCVYQLQGFLRLLTREDYPLWAAVQSWGV